MVLLFRKDLTKEAELLAKTIPRRLDQRIPQSGLVNTKSQASRHERRFGTAQDQHERRA